MSLLEIKYAQRPSNQYLGGDLDPSILADSDDWPHLKELELCLLADYVHIDNKYGHFEGVPPAEFEPQIFPTPVSDRTSGVNKPTGDDGDYDDCHERDDEHYGGSPLVAFNPVFKWDSERAAVIGNRLPIRPVSATSAGMRFSVRILSMNVQPGLAEPFYGTICLYHVERKEKISEDFYFQFLPHDWEGDSTSPDQRAVFSVESQSPSLCLLLQLEKHAAEESSTGVKTAVYSRKDPPLLTDKEVSRLSEWSQMMPFRESFSWVLLPLFDASVTRGAGGFGATPDATSAAGGATSSPGVSGTASPELKAPTYELGGPPVQIEIPLLYRAKECYTDDQLFDPKRKLHKPVRVNMKVEIERLPAVPFGGAPPTTPRAAASGVNRPRSHESNGSDGDELAVATRSLSFSRMAQGFHCLDFTDMLKPEPFTRLLHFYFVYPQSIQLPKKFNLFVRVELRADDNDIQKPALEALCSREKDGPLLRSAFSQVVAGARPALFHDEFKIQLPAVITKDHHLLFTFFHIDLVMKNEAPKPTAIGYSVMPLHLGINSLKADINLPVSKDLMPRYLDTVKHKLTYWEEGRPIFRVRSRMFSSLFPLSDRVRDFFHEYNQHVLVSSLPGNDLLDAINSLKAVDLPILMQFLYPILNMLLAMIGNGVETLQVAGFRAMINIVSRIQAEVPSAGNRNKFLVHFVDFIFDDLGRQQAPVYPGLSNVWRSLARSKAKGYRVGPVYDEALSMAWFVLELIVKSMDLELAQVPQGDEIARLRLEDEVFQCIWQLFECLLNEVHERAHLDAAFAKRLSNSVSFFCFDLISVVDPPQVFELVGMFLTKFAGMCPPVLHALKLQFLRIVCDHDFYIETPGRVPIEKNYLSTVLLKELFISLDHEDQSQRSLAAQMLTFLFTKHEYDARYQPVELKLYIAQLYFPIIGMMLEEVTVFNNLEVSQKRNILVCMLTIIRNLDDESLLKMWKQSEVRTRLFFRLLEHAATLLQYKEGQGSWKKLQKAGQAAEAESGEGIDDNGLINFSDCVSPSTNDYLDEATKQDPKLGLDRDLTIRRMGHVHSGSIPQTSSASHSSRVLSQREAMAATRLTPKEAMASLRQKLPSNLLNNLLLWEANLAAWSSLEVLEVLEKFSDAAAERVVSTDYSSLDCLTGPLAALLDLPQPVSFWGPFVPSLAQMLRLHGGAMLGSGRDRVVKDMMCALMRRFVLKPEYVRKRVLISLLLLLRNALRHHSNANRLKVMLTISLSEVLSLMKLLHKSRDGSLSESADIERLRLALEEMGNEDTAFNLLAECGLPESCLDAQAEEEEEEREGRVREEGLVDGWSWDDVRELQETLLTVIDAAVQHAQLLEGLKSSGDRYAIVESYYILAQAYGHVPDLYIMWMLHLCETHQEMSQWAEAAQCAVSVAGIVMRALQATGQSVWSKEHLEVLWRVCPLARHQWRAKALMEGLGATSLNVDSAVRYLHMASTFFSKAELFHFCAEMLSLMLPAFKSTRDYQQLSKCHTSLTSIYESIQSQETSPIPFKDATYYRVGFYGERFGYINGREFIYREPWEVRLGDIMEKLKRLYDSKSKKEEPLHIIQDSRQVDPSALKPDFVYMQITAVEPVVGEGEDKWLGRSLEPSVAGMPIFGCFMFDTPFTENGKQQGKMEDQWKRRTLLYTQSTLPSLISRQPVIRSEVREYSPIECAIQIIESRTHALDLELASQVDKNELPGATGTLQLPRLQSLQRLLQGSVALQVNSGVLGVCMAFYRPSTTGIPTPKEGSCLDPQDVDDLTSTIVRFVAVCKKAIGVHGRAVKDEDQDFQEQLVRSYEDLVMEISNFIPDIRKKSAAIAML